MLKRLLICALVAACAFAQSTASPVASGVSLDRVSLPTYTLFGVALNQFQGVNLFASFVSPESQKAGMFYSLSIDMTPVKVTTGGKTGYLLSGSGRFGQHKQLYFDGKNWLSIGADVGPSFASNNPPAAPAGATPTLNIGVAGSLTVTYARQLTKHWGIAIPIRMLYQSNVLPNGGGAWNPVVEISFAYIK